MENDGSRELARLDMEADRLSADALALDLRLKAAAHDPLLDDNAFLVLCDAADYAFAKDLVARHDLSARCTVLFSPESSSMDKVWLAERIVEDRLPVRFQLQLHKVLWGERSGV